MMQRSYDRLKRHDDGIYTGMRIGGSHRWNYEHGTWQEVKTAPDRWKMRFDCVKHRFKPAPPNSGARVKTKYHWYIIADQVATKLNANSYMTKMSGVKFKIGHKRPNWRRFSYQYPEQSSYRERVIQILETALKKLKEEENGNPF